MLKKTEAVISAIAKGLAIFGGVLLTAVALLTVVSITGRALVDIGLAPVTGDFELVEAGCAVAVFCFLPWCQLNRGHVTVDIFVDKAPPRVFTFLSLIGNIALSAIAVVIAWRLGLGLGEKFSYGETTFILGMPVWYGFALGFIGAAAFAVTALFTVWRSLDELARGVRA